MRKSMILIGFALLAGYVSQAQDGVKFLGLDWEAALDKARVEQKLIFLEGYVTWSEPCEIMEKYTLSDKEAGDYYNERFINIQLDMEDFPGALLAEEYEVASFPVMLFVNGKGEVVHRGCGAIEAQEFIDLGKAALSENNLASMQAQFVGGERSLDFLVAYSLLLDDACLDSRQFVDTFFQELPHGQWMEEAAWTMINLNVDDPFSEPFQYLMAYHDMFSLKYGKDTVDQKIYNVLLDQLIDIYEGADLTLFATQALRQLISSVDFQDNQELISLTDLKTADLKENWPKYAENAVKVVSEQSVADPDQLNEFAWKFYLFVDDEQHLRQAAGWMKEVLKDYPDATYYDTYASLLFKLGERDEAIKYAEKALQAAEIALEDLMHYKTQLKLFGGGN